MHRCYLSMEKFEDIQISGVSRISWRRGANPIFATFSQKLHEIKEMSVLGDFEGALEAPLPLHPPLQINNIRALLTNVL